MGHGGTLTQTAFPVLHEGLRTGWSITIFLATDIGVPNLRQVRVDLRDGVRQPASNTMFWRPCWPWEAGVLLDASPRLNFLWSPEPPHHPRIWGWEGGAGS